MFHLTPHATRHRALPCTLSSIQSSTSRYLPSGGPNLGKTLCHCPHLAPQMAGLPFPSFYYTLRIAASVVAIPTKICKSNELDTKALHDLLIDLILVSRILIMDPSPLECLLSYFTIAL